ncbi:MAG: hypothetical protein JJ896_11945 [Rhodothermales bacterium]|nr:hypothetical protein [Rhodothermales bacterium]MBO6780356.1 hypothetical protein [Rhodothermales bacterium]
MEPDRCVVEAVGGPAGGFITLTRVGVGPLLTPAGRFWMYQFVADDEWGNYQALVKVDELGQDLRPRFVRDESLLVRLDSGCATGQVFSDVTCECSEQLRLAMERIQRSGQGVVVHCRAQDGRGMGTAFKLGTLWMQSDWGLDTVGAAVALAGSQHIDRRTYGGMIAVLQYLGVRQSQPITVATNNPDKIAAFISNGFSEVKRQEIVIGATRHTGRHLRAKAEHLGHLGLGARS